MNKFEFIRLARLLSVISIFFCHVFQYYGNFFAFHLNTAVFVFLFISGFLFGNRHIDDTGVFFKKRFKRLLVPYYVFIIFLIILYLLLKPSDISVMAVIKNLLCVQWFASGISNTGHLWYVTAIVICYLFTPILQKVSDYFKVYHAVILFFVLSILMVLTDYNFICLYAYVVGYFTSKKLVNMNIKNSKRYLLIIAIFGLIVEGCRIFADVKGIHIPGIVVECIKLFVAIAVVCFCFILQDRLQKFINIFTFIDKYSYEIYLTHHIWVLGILSVMGVTKYGFLNVALAAGLTILSSIALGFISNKIIKKEVQK